MRIDPNPCFILHCRPYRETSSMAEVFSRQEGRLTLVVRGARTTRKGGSNQALLQPYQKVLIGWYGRGEMGTVNKLESGGIVYSLKGRRLISGFYINELTLRLLHRHEPHTDLFDAYERALSALSHGDDEQGTLRIYEKQILGAVGFGLVLDHETRSLAPLDDDTLYYYQPESGPTRELPDKNGQSSVKVHGRTLRSLAEEQFEDNRDLEEARALMRQIITGILGPKPLASRDLYQSYIRYT